METDGIAIEGNETLEPDGAHDVNKIMLASVTDQDEALDLEDANNENEKMSAYTYFLYLLSYSNKKSESSLGLKNNLLMQQTI